jgi:hypothetical protein
VQERYFLIKEIVMTEHANDMQLKPSVREAFHVAGRRLFDVQAQLWKLDALLDAMTEMECLQSANTDDLVKISLLVEMGRDVARQGDKAADEYRRVFENLAERVQYQPEAGDPMPVDLWASMLEAAVLDEVVTDSSRMDELVKFADTLRGYAIGNDSSGLHAALSAWLGMLERKGAQIRIVPGAARPYYGYSWRDAFKPRHIRTEAGPGDAAPTVGDDTAGDEEAMRRNEFPMRAQAQTAYEAVEEMRVKAQAMKLKRIDTHVLK